MKDSLYVFRKGFNYSQDGPGNRLIYHLKGCNLKCPWCSNPEGMRLDPGDRATPVSDLVAEAISCVPMFFDGGGVTLTGGEVCMQSEAVVSFLRQLKENGIHTAIETNASLPGFRDLLPFIDYLMVDWKQTDPDRAEEVIGARIEAIRENFLYALSSGYTLHIRIPLIHGFNDGEREREQTVAFLSSLPGIFDVELLPYHEYGKEKWQKAGREYTVTDGFVPDETLRAFRSALEDAHLTVIKT